MSLDCLHRTLVLAIALLGAATTSAPAHAQLRLPTLPTGPLSPVESLGRTTLDRGTRTLSDVDRTLAPTDLSAEREAEIARRLARAPRVLARNARGDLVVRDELIAVPSSDAAAASARAAGFTVLREESAEGVDLRWQVWRAPAGLSSDEALRRLRLADPAGTYDDQAVFLGAGSVGGDGAPSSPSSKGPVEGRVVVGLLDTGLDVRREVFHGVTVHRHGCGDDAAAHPAAHGHAVASLLVGEADKFHAAAPGATLYAADAYCDEPTGGAAARVVRELGWLVAQRVPVVAMSLVGPQNALLEHAVAAAVARGTVVVAPVGNDGPAAPPLYPAAWPGVVGVTAVDARGRLLAEAGRGPAVMLAAPGADMAAAALGEDAFVPVRGTSFAVPLVAGLIAGRYGMGYGPDVARRAVEAVAATARDLGPPGRDDGYGRGLVAESLRTSPDKVPLAHR